MVLEHDVSVASPVVIMPMGIAIVVTVGDRVGGGVHGRVWGGEAARRRRGLRDQGTQDGGPPQATAATRMASSEARETRSRPRAEASSRATAKRIVAAT